MSADDDASADAHSMGLPPGSYRYASGSERYVCAACGKTSATRYGDTADKSPGWDVSCAMNSVLCRPATDAEKAEQPGCQWVGVDNI